MDSSQITNLAGSRSRHPTAALAPHPETPARPSPEHPQEGFGDQAAQGRAGAAREGGGASSSADWVILPDEEIKRLPANQGCSTEKQKEIEAKLRKQDSEIQKLKAKLELHEQEAQLQSLRARWHAAQTEKVIDV